MPSPEIKRSDLRRSRSRTPANLRVRQRESSDIAAIRAMMQRVYPPPHGQDSVWSEGALELHLDVFPEGQFVAETEYGTLVGSATSMLVPMSVALESHTWREVTERGTLAPHDPEGKAMYGVNIIVDPDYQGRGIASRLYDARFALARQLGCEAMVAGARIPGYCLEAAGRTAESYVQAVVEGTLWDPTLSKQLKLGFKVKRVLPNYAADPETLGYAALVVRDLRDPDAV